MSWATLLPFLTQQLTKQCLAAENNGSCTTVKTVCRLTADTRQITSWRTVHRAKSAEDGIERTNRNVAMAIGGRSAVDDRQTQNQLKTADKRRRQRNGDGGQSAEDGRQTETAEKQRRRTISWRRRTNGDGRETETADKRRRRTKINSDDDRKPKISWRMAHAAKHRTNTVQR